MFSSLFKGVGKAVKGVVKGVKKVVKKTADFTKKALKNKYVRAGLLITAAVMLPGAIALAAPALSSVAVGAITGAVVGAGGGIIAGKKPKEWLASGAIGAATGAAFAKIGQSIKAAQATKVAGNVDALGNLDAGKFQASLEGIQDSGQLLNETAFAAPIDSSTAIGKSIQASQDALANVTSGAENVGNPFDWKAAATEAGINAGVQTGVGVVQQQIADATTDEPVTFGSRGVNNMFDSYRRGVAQLTGNYLASGMSSGSNTAQIYGDLVNSLAYGNGTADYGQMAGVSLLNGVEVPGLQYTV
tara:strand:- start:3438 stop:4343 length:906 start_codon:yes stop_codon:yes gene_type:complete